MPSPKLLPGYDSAIRGIGGYKELFYVGLSDDEVVTWKELLLALAERCWTRKRGPNRKFLAKESIPLLLECAGDPLHSCDKGKDVDATFTKEARDPSPLASQSFQCSKPHTSRVCWWRRRHGNPEIGREVWKPPRHVCTVVAQESRSCWFAEIARASCTA